MRKYHIFSAGYQTRTVSCFATRNSDGIPNLADKQADQHLCDVTTRPTSLQTCDVIGLNECIFSDWSLWSSCYGRNGTVISGRTSSCSLAFRKRTRSVYRGCFDLVKNIDFKKCFVK